MYSVSVTALIGQQFDTFDALTMSKKMVGRQKYIGLTHEQIMAKWKENGERASAKGTMIHAAIEDGINDGVWLDHPAVDATRKRLVAGDFGCPFMCEAIVHGTNKKGAKLPGSIDLIFVDDNNEFHLGDWKYTSNDMDVAFKDFVLGGTRLKQSLRVKYSLQLHIYRIILQAPPYNLNIPSSNLHILKVNDEACEDLGCENLEDEARFLFESMETN